MSQQAIAFIKASNGPGNYCLNVLSSLSLSDKENLSLVIGDTLITFNKHIVCSLSPWIFSILKDECCCLKEHVFISLPEETFLRGFLSLKAVIETGVTHELAIHDKDELYCAIKLLGMNIQLNTVVQENVDNGSSAERHEELEELNNIANIDIDEENVDECISDMDGSHALQHESVVSNEYMFTHNVEVESEQTISVGGMDGDDTNNNTTQPKINNGMEEIQDESRDLEVLEEINMVNSIENAHRNLNSMKPVFKECKVRINRISIKSFGMMRNCSVKIKRLDRKFDKALKYLKPNDTITQKLHKETGKNPKQCSHSNQISPMEEGTCFPQASSSAAPPQQDLHKHIDGNNVQESRHSTVMLHSANCDEFFSSIGHVHSTDDGEVTPSHAHLEDSCQDTHSYDHLADNCQDTPSHDHSAADDREIPSHAHSRDDDKATKSSHFLTPIKVSKRSNPPQFDGHMSEMDDVNTEEEGIAFIDEININKKTFYCLTNNVKTVPKTSSSERISLLTELANTDDVNTDGSDLDRDINISARFERFHDDDTSNKEKSELISNISSSNEKHKNKIVPKTSSSQGICLLSEWVDTEDNVDEFDMNRDKVSDIIDGIVERAPGDIRCPIKNSHKFSSNECQRRKPIPQMSSSDKICFLKESLERNVDYGTLDLNFENQERDLFDVIENSASKDKQIPPVSNASISSPHDYDGSVDEKIYMEVDNGDLDKGQRIHDGSSTSMLPSELDAELVSIPTPSLLGCSKSSKNHGELSNDEEDEEKQIELVPKIRIKRNLIQWAFEFDLDSILTPPRKTSKRLNVSSDDETKGNQLEESPKNTAKIKSKVWKPYSEEEDERILRYMKENDMIGRQKGRRVWQLMEEDNVCPGRSWQSMKERWIKRIQRKLINSASDSENE